MSRPATAARETWHALDRPAVEAALGTGPRGLTEEEADARLRRYGPNRLQEAPPPSALAILLHQFASPLIYILLAATLVTFFLGKYIDTAVIGVVLALNAVIGFVQEYRAERSVRALMGLVSPRARVIRDGREWEVASEVLVPGDLVLLETGVRVPADLRLVATTALSVDESLLTGESLPVAKRSSPVEPAAAVADRTDMAHAGTVVASGRGQGVVVATAGATELGAIAARLRGEGRAPTPMQHRMDRLARAARPRHGACSSPWRRPARGGLRLIVQREEERTCT